MTKFETSKSLAINLPIESQYRLAECIIKKPINQEWFMEEFISSDPETHEYLFDTCDVSFIGNMAYIALFSSDQQSRNYAKLFLDNLKEYNKKLTTC